MINKGIYLYLLFSIMLVVLAAFVSLQASVSFYEARYGRELIFTGLSKYVLTASVLLSAGSFYLVFRSKSKGYEVLGEGIKPLMGFTFSAISLIVAVVLENDIF